MAHATEMAAEPIYSVFPVRLQVVLKQMETSMTGILRYEYADTGDARHVVKEDAQAELEAKTEVFD